MHRESAVDHARVAELPFWQEVTATPDPQLGARAFDPEVDTFATVERVEVSLSAEVTLGLLPAGGGVIRTANPLDDNAVTKLGL
ncbi:hypothetical protein [Nocardia cyriacigeorgica]|uniref:hypothetical protein n=1 Tax=Nocardia cyriacigeorgica TaxID=135487 RepID=UPI002456D096|nr:hypothetical protein [Nocardia cyriacigeorgica]